MMLIGFLFEIGRRAALGSAICLCIAAANAQGLPQMNRSHSFGPDQCGAGDSSYIQAANETGGVPLFLQRNEARLQIHCIRGASGNQQCACRVETNLQENTNKPIPDIRGEI